MFGRHFFLHYFFVKTTEIEIDLCTSNHFFMNILKSNFCHEGMNELHVTFPLLYFIHYKEKPQLDFLHPYINHLPVKLDMSCLILVIALGSLCKLCVWQIFSTGKLLGLTFSK